MFKSIGKSLTDLSIDLREREDWEVGTLRTFDHILNATTFAFDPVSSILAVGELLPCFWVRWMSSGSTGTIDGTIRIFGAPDVETSLSLPSHAPIKFLQFSTNLFKLVCIGERSMCLCLKSHLLCPGFQTKVTSCTYGTSQRKDRSS